MVGAVSISGCKRVVSRDTRGQSAAVVAHGEKWENRRRDSDPKKQARSETLPGAHPLATQNNKRERREERG